MRLSKTTIKQAFLHRYREVEAAQHEESQKGVKGGDGTGAGPGGRGGEVAGQRDWGCGG